MHTIDQKRFWHFLRSWSHLFFFKLDPLNSIQLRTLTDETCPNLFETWNLIVQTFLVGGDRPSVLMGSVCVCGWVGGLVGGVGGMANGG